MQWDEPPEKLEPRDLPRNLPRKVNTPRNMPRKLPRRHSIPPKIPREIPLNDFQNSTIARVKQRRSEGIVTRPPWAEVSL